MKNINCLLNTLLSKSYTELVSFDPGNPLCYFEFVLNPDSFGQTIENIFYASFLIRVSIPVKFHTPL